MSRCEFIGNHVPDPCPRKTAKHGCLDCQDDIREREAIIEALGKVYRKLAESLAREQAIRSLPGQRKMNL